MSIIFTLLAILQIAVIFATREGTTNLAKFMQHRRKRTLIFENSGTLKLVIGPAFKVDLGDAVTFRSLVCSYNLQGGHYDLPTLPSYPWDRWSEDERKQTHKDNNTDTRILIYKALEIFLDKQGKNGYICVLRTICEYAHINSHASLMELVVKTILEPTTGSVYREAYEIGLAGADCISIYFDCPHTDNVLDDFLSGVHYN